MQVSLTPLRQPLDQIRGQIIELVLDEPELSLYELAVGFTGTKQYFVSEARVYRILKTEDMITSPAYMVIKVANEFKDKSSRLEWDYTYV